MAKQGLEGAQGAAMGRLLVGVSLVLLASAGIGRSQPASPYGGWARLRAPATGWFRTQRVGGRWWLVDPQGQGFLSLGVNGITLNAGWPPEGPAGAYRDAALRKYGSAIRWGPECLARLRSWGFTTVGTGSDPVVRGTRAPYLLSLELSSALRLPEGQRFPDVFSPGFAAGARKMANRLCRPRADDPWLVGYVTDSELPWATPATVESLFVQFLRLSDATPGRAALLDFLEDRYLEVEALNEAWHADYATFAEVGRVPQADAAIPTGDEEDFARLVAEQYFRVTHDAIRGVDANHLIFGGRFPGVPSKAVLEVMRDYVDGVCLRVPGTTPPAAALRALYQTARLPVLIGEFSAAELEGGQEEGGLSEEARGRRYARFVAEAMALPMVIGCHWISYYDGAGAPTGLVNGADEPYRVFVDRVTRANREAYARHAGERPARAVTSAASPRRAGVR